MSPLLNSNSAADIPEIMNDDPQFNQLRAIIDGDGSEIRRQFILAGLFLTIFERFKKCLVDCVDSFFSHRTEIKDGNLFHIRGEEFKKLIKEKGFDEAGQHKNKAFRAALY